ncbi:SDR family NAD(P)-dependent oxidoreductase, partial [Brucella sp. 21LCYQ03]|nr:SDR family NAD(P)-dependent oxidoreductase [Brucella sp. 21LCYQ03]
LNLAEEHLATEAFLKESGVPFTILRNGWYTENYAGSISGSVAAGAYIGSAGEGKIASASREDFAEAAAVVLLEEGHEGKVYELAGDDAYTLADFAAVIAKEADKDIPYHNLTDKEYSDMLISFGVPEGFAPMIASWDVAASKGDLYSDDKTLSKLIGRPTTPWQDTVKAALS